MLNKSDEYWASVRQVPLTKKESNMDVFMNRIEQIPGFKYVIFGAKALIENFVETGTKKHPSKVRLRAYQYHHHKQLREWHTFPSQWYDHR